MYKTYIHYRPDTGEIIGWVADHRAPTAPGFIESPEGMPLDGNAWYVRDGLPTRRPANPAQLVKRELRDLPVPCMVVINDSSYPCHEGTAALDLTYPGTYQVKIIAFPIRNALFELTV